MDLIPVRFGDVEYPFHLGTDCADDLAARLLELRGSAYFVVCDSNVARTYDGSFVRRLRGQAPVYIVEHRPGERHKTFAAARALLDRMLALGADKFAVIVALGGGVTGNLAGLAAALLYRGVRLVHAPTTLLAMLDSVLSLKQTVNSAQGKNQLGTFHAPAMVLADTAYLRTLPPRHVRSGVCEVVKNALAIDPSGIGWLREALREDSAYSDEVLRELVRRSIAAKMSVMAADKLERGRALVLEYGHTVGHAVEHLMRGRITHGEAVGVGMRAAADVAQGMGLLPAADAAAHRELLERAGAPVTIPNRLTADDILAQIGRDKKRGYVAAGEDVVPMLLLEGLGRLKWNGESPFTPVPAARVREVVGRYLAAPRRRGLAAPRARVTRNPGVGAGFHPRPS